jgi:hypothetical protein
MIENSRLGLEQDREVSAIAGSRVLVVETGCFDS